MPAVEAQLIWKRYVDRVVVLAGGDTDTNAAVAGAVLGGIQSYEAIPASWLECVPGHDRLTQLANQLLMQDAINT